MDGDVLPNWDFVGRCYDILNVDPFNIEAGTKPCMAFDFPKDKKTHELKLEYIPDKRFMKPLHTVYTPATGGTSDTNTVSLSSSYDFKSFTKTGGSVSASDPTGDLYSASLSASYEQTRQATQSNNQVVTYASYTVNSYHLKVGEDDDAPDLSAGLMKAVNQLSQGSDYRKFVETFGTHYASNILFGGQAHQRIVLQEQDYSSFLEEGLDVEEQAAMTFDIAKVSQKGSSTDKRSKKFVSATRSSTENIVYTGGYPQQMFDMWSMSVKDMPGPIQVELRPIYELLTADRFPDDHAIDTKRKALQDATEEYLRNNGEDVQKAVLKYGDTVSLQLVGTGAQDRYLSGGDPHYTHTLPAPKSGTLDTTMRWVLVKATDPDLKDEVKVGDIIALCNASTGKFLDAQAGSDGSHYYEGDGLTEDKASDPSQATAQWQLILADARTRIDNEMVDGDFVRFKSLWQDPDGEFGYLQGESDYRDPGQRVYSFGKPPGGTNWRVARLDGS